MGAQSTAGDADRRRGLVRGAVMRRRVLSAVLVLGFGLSAVPAVAAGGSVFHPAPGSPFRTPGSADVVEFSPNGRLLASGSEESYENGTSISAVTLFSVSSRGQLHKLPGSLVAHNLLSLSLGPFSPNGRSLLVWHEDRFALYAVGGGGLTGKHSPSWTIPGLVNGGGVFSPDGRFLAILGGTTLWLFSVTADGSLVQVPRAPVAFGNSDTPNGVAFSPDDRFIAGVNTSKGRLVL